jgi:hypothetical protein
MPHHKYEFLLIVSRRHAGRASLWFYVALILFSLAFLLTTTTSRSILLLLLHYCANMLESKRGRLEYKLVSTSEGSTPYLRTNQALQLQTITRRRNRDSTPEEEKTGTHSSQTAIKLQSRNSSSQLNQKCVHGTLGPSSQLDSQLFIGFADLFRDIKKCKK